jgi:transmembrane sensor
MSKASDISDAAAQWLIRLEGQTTPETWDAFQSWVDESPRHRAAFVRLRVAWNKVDLLKYMRPADGTIDADLLTPPKITPATLMARGLQPLQGAPRRRTEDLVMPDRRRVVGIAVAIAASGVFAWIGAYHHGWKTYETGIGALEKDQLEDGSTVDLNTSTVLNVRISGSRREVTLVHGEALFHVAHDPSRPFYVTAGGTVVRAVGTAFSVRIRDAEHVDVLVEEGRVAVGAPGTEANFENPSLLAKAEMVSAGEAARVRPKSVFKSTLTEKDIARKLAWTTGRLVFQGETLEDAVQEFNRYNERKITIADASILNVPIQMGGSIRTTDPDSFIAALRQMFGFRTEVGKNNDIRLFAGDKPP